MQLAIIGKISSSKSTLVNAILGKTEVVRTGKMEETYNVSWIKYGKEDEDIDVVFKNGHHEKVAHSQWANWASRQGENKLRDQVKYISVSYPHELLKKINIIDTPGLSAESQIDSLNTISFLSEVRPDAVLILFSKSIDEASLSVLNDFQQSEVAAKFSLTPLNAIGILAKADTIWAANKADTNVIEEGNRTVKSYYYDFPQLSNSLFSIYPLSALIGLASSALSEDQIITLKELSMLDNTTFSKMLHSSVFFKKNYPNVNVSVEQREKLYRELGGYGIYEAVRHIQNTPDWSRESLVQTLKECSGLDTFLKVLFSHFGERSSLIKSQNSIKRVIDACEKYHYRNETINEIQEKIISLLLSISEYEEWDNLSKIYSGEMTSEIPNALDTYKRICGEYGSSLCERLDLPSNTSKEVLHQRIESQIRYWTRKYNIEHQRFPKEINVFRMIIKSYRMLLEKANSMLDKERDAKMALSRVNDFFYGPIV